MIGIVSLNNVIANKLLPLDWNIWNHITEQADNCYNAIFKKCDFKKGLQWYVKSIVLIVIKHLQMNQILALNNPLGVDMPLNK